METQTFLELVNMMGFPIAACIALFWANRESTKYHREMLKDFRNIIEQNTKAINRILDKMDGH